jgi:hypothetical protein
VLLVLLLWLGRVTPGRGRGKWPAVTALMPLMAGRLDEGLRSEIKGGGESRPGVKTSPSISRSEVRRREVVGGDERKWQRSTGGGGR